MPPGPPMNTTPITPVAQKEYIPEVEEDDDDISDIVSEKAAEDGEDDVKEVKLPPAKAKKGGRKKKVEINL